MRTRLDALRFALRGAVHLFATQPHARFHLAATLGVVSLGTYLGISSLEWAILVAAIAMVWLAEAMNTALEFLADEVTLEWRERIMKAKDIAAFGVLSAAVASVIAGALIFVPRLMRL